MAKKRIYKTNKGKIIDIEAMRIANERTVAAGNMRVNSKGDELKGGKIVKTAKERVAPHYKSKKQVARTSLKPPIKKKDAQLNTVTDLVEEEKEPTVNIKTRDDGSQYKEIMYADGTIETEEIEAAPVKKKASKKSAKKKTNKKPAV